MAGDAPPADMPERNDLSNGEKALAAVLASRRSGEALQDAAGNVDNVLARMSQEARVTDTTIQDNADGLVIGGIRVPRRDGREQVFTRP